MAPKNNNISTTNKKKKSSINKKSRNIMKNTNTNRPIHTKEEWARLLKAVTCLPAEEDAAIIAMLNKPYQADEVLAEFTGIQIGSNADFGEAIWVYVKVNNLQKEGNGRIVIPDAKFAELMGNGEEEVNAFYMVGHILGKRLKEL